MIVVKGFLNSIECFLETDKKEEIEKFQQGMDGTEYMTSTYAYEQLQGMNRIDWAMTGLFISSAIFSAFALFGMYSAFYGGC